VYTARQTSLNRLVALKVEKGRSNEEFVGQVHAGLTIQAGLQHPNICQIFDWGTIGDGWYSSMELCTGGTLSERLRRGPLTAYEAAELVATLADAVGALHRARAIHRNLKPGVVLFTESGTPKLTSLELALLLENTSEEMEGTIVGTPVYMAPEQARGSVAELGPACDIFGLGAILYECLTGQPPWRGINVHETLAMAAEGNLTPPSHFNTHCPRDLQAICLKCLSRDPSARYSTANDLAEDLRRFIRGEEVVARPRGGLERAWNLVRRNASWAIMISAVMLANLFFWLFYTAWVAQSLHGGSRW
jgi:serine/threonine-protein kinase